MKGLGYKSVAVVSSLPTPSTALAGVTLRLSSDNHPYWCDGSAWIDLTTGGGAPAAPSLGLVYAMARGLAMV